MGVQSRVASLVVTLRERPLLADCLLAAGLLAVVLAAGFTTDDAQSSAADGWFVVLAIMTVVPVAIRRRWPVPAFVVSIAGLMLLQAVDYFDNGAGVATLVCAYTVSALADRRAARWTLLAFVAAITAYYLAGVVEDQEGATIPNLLATYFLVGTAWVLGDMVRRRREREADLEERALRAERERQLLAQHAVAEERAAIARELHDSVAHALSVIVIQAGAARRLCGADPERAAQALEAVEVTGRQSLAELRRVVGALRDPTEAMRTPQPTLARLGELVAADPSLPVVLRVEGEPLELAPSVERSAFRIVQEALTNVRKHAGPARAEVVVRYEPDVLELVVTDDGRGGGAAPRPRGHGLVGMQERAALCGGAVRAGPLPGGGWRVTARLPLEPVPA